MLKAARVGSVVARVGSVGESSPVLMGVARVGSMVSVSGSGFLTSCS